MRVSCSVLLLLLSLSFVPAASPAGAAGALDPTFGIGGKVITRLLPIGGAARALVVQPDGKIVAGGGVLRGFRGSDFLLARYLPDGSLDPSFGNGGLVKTEFRAGGSEITALALQPDGKIVAVGRSNGGAPFFAGDFRLARYHPDGRLDTSFGGGGMVSNSFGGADHPAAVALLPDGRIVVAGSRAIGPLPSDFLIAVYESDGSLSPDFGDGGWVLTNFPGEGPLPFQQPIDEARAVVVQPDGRIVAAGVTSLGNLRVALVRYEPDGSLDTSFGEDGLAARNDLGSFSEWAFAAALQPDGRIVVAGRRFGGTFDFLVERYLPDGRADTGFGTNGWSVVDFFGEEDSAYAVLLQPDGGILLAGLAQRGPAFEGTDFALARFTASGILDTSFGTAGRVTTDFFGRYDQILAAALQPDGRIVVAGWATEPAPSGHGQFALARYLTNRPPVITGAAVSQPVLWPPNHKLVDVSVFYQVTDDQDPAPRCALRVTSDEPVNGTGDGDTAPDWQVIDAHRVRLRAERAGRGDGRVYSIAITCTDSGGASAGKVVTVSVPLPQDRRP